MRASDYRAGARYDVRTDSPVAVQRALDMRVTSGRLLTRTAPRWVDRLYIALVIYAIACSVFMLCGIGGKQVTHYVGLFSDAPADLVAAIVAFTAARRTRQGPLRQAWTWLPIALTLYLVGTLITI